MIITSPNCLGIFIELISCFKADLYKRYDSKKMACTIFRPWEKFRFADDVEYS